MPSWQRVSKQTYTASPSCGVADVGGLALLAPGCATLLLVLERRLGPNLPLAESQFHRLTSIWFPLIHSFPLSPFRKRRVLRRIVYFCRFQVEIHPAIEAWGLSSIRRGLLCLSDFFELIPSTEGTRRRAGYSQSLVTCHVRAREGADRDCFEVVGIELCRSEAQWNVEECKQAEAVVTSNGWPNKKSKLVVYH